MTPPRQPRPAGLRLIGTVRRDRASLLRSTALQAAVLSVVALPAAAQPAPNARPTGGAVVAGSASIGQSASTTTVNQASQRAAVNWQSFDVGSQQSVVFNQPTRSAVTLNRVMSPNPSAIAGQIKANGTVVLTNQSGLVVYPGAQVDAQGVILSAAGITNKNFMAGKLVFDQAAHPGAAVVNQGSITVGQTGLAALVAPQVANSGVITAKLGHVVLAGAEAATLDMYGDGLLSIDVTKQVTKAGSATALVTNSGTVLADGGTVQITAAAADGVVQTLVNAGGRIQANSVGAQTGTIIIEGTGGSLQVTGSVVAQGRAAGTTGGQIELNASGTVALAASARVSASGQAGGGTVAVGTTLARANGGVGGTSTLTASAVTMVAGARISADARANGQGGHVTLLSTGSTAFAGRITARGGTAGGDGGLVELSGNTLTLGGSVDTEAPAGNPWHIGSVLIDPQDLVISDTQVSHGTTSVITTAAVEAIVGNVTLQTTHDLTVASSVTLTTVGQGLTLDAGHNVTVDSGVTLSTKGSISLIAADSSLASTPDGSITIQNAVAAPTVVTTTGVLSLTSGTTDIALGGSITAAQLVLNAGAGVAQTPTDAVSGNANVVSVGTVSGSVGSLSLAGGNAIATLGTLAATSGNIAVTEAPATALAVTGSVTVPSDKTIVLTTDTLTIPGSLNAGTGMVALAPATTANGVLVKASGANAVNALNLALGDLQNITAGTLQLGGTLGGGIAIGNAGDLINLRNITTLNLLSGGAITEGGSLSVGTLSGAANSVTLTGGNTISTLGSFSSSTGFALTDSNTLFVNATVSDPTGITLTTTSGDIQLLALLSTTAGTLSLHSAGAITQGGGLLDAATLTGTAGSVTLDGQNIIDTLGSFTSSVGFELADSFALLTVAGPVQAGTGITLTERDGLQLIGTLSGPGGIAATPSITLAGTGDITQSATSKLFTTSLTSSGTIAGNVTLGGQNAIGTLAGFAATGNLSVSNATALTATGTIAAGNGQTLTLLADSLTATGATLRAHQGKIALAPFTSGNAFSFGGTQFAADATFDATTLQIGSATAGNINVTGVVNPGVSLLDLVSGGSITQDTASVITVPTLTGSVQGGVSLLGTNAIGTLDGFTSAGGFTLVNGQTLTVTGSVQDGTGIALTENGGLQLNGTLAGTGGVAATPSITLAGTGDITQATTAELFATSLSSTGTIAGNVTLGGLNTIATLAGFAVTGNLSVRDSAALTATGTIAAGNGQTLTLLADSLTATGATLRAHQGRVVLAPYTANHAITFGNALFGADATVDATTLQVGSATAGNIGVTGVVDPGVTVLDLVSGGSITQDTASVITVATLTGSVPNGSVALLGTNAIATLDGFTSSGGFALVDGQTLTVAGVSDPTGISLTTTSGDIVLAGDVTTMLGTLLLTSAGAITQTGGTLTAATLDGSAALGVGLTLAGNAITTLGSFTSGSGFALKDGETLTIAGPLTDQTGISLTTTAGDIVLAGDVTTTFGTLLLTSAGAITQTGGTVTAATLDGSAALGVGLTLAGNAIATLGSFTSGSGFALKDAQTLTVAGPIIDPTGISLTTTAGGIVLAGDLTTTLGALSLTSAGAITQTGGTLTAAMLDGSAALGVGLTLNGNAITTLGSFTSGSGFALNDASFLTVAGQVQDGTRIALTENGGLQINGTLAGTGGIAATPSITLAGTGDITQAATSKLFATSLTSAGTIAGNVTLAGRNAIGTLAGFAATGNLSVSNATALRASGTIAAGNGQTLTLLADSLTATGATLRAHQGRVVLAPYNAGHAITFGNALFGADATFDATTLQVGSANTGNIAITGVVDPGVAVLDLVSGGSITQDAASVITVGTLTGSVPNGSVGLLGTNAITTLDGFASSGGFAIVDGQALTVADVSDQTGISLKTTSGDIVLAGDVTTTLGTLLLTSAGAITQTGGTVTAATLDGSAALGVGLTLAGNAIATLGSFTSGSGFALQDARTLTVAGPLTDPTGIALTTTAGDIVLAGDVTTTSGTLLLTSSGAITQTGGTVTAATLDGSAALGVGLTLAGNAIVTLGSFTSGSGFALKDARTLLVDGPVTDPTGISLTTTSGDILLSGDVTTTLGTLLLESAGAITQTGGALTAAAVEGSAALGVGLTLAGNAIITLGSFTSGSGFALRDARTLTVAGPLTDSTGISLTTTAGNIVLAGDVTTTLGTLLLTSAGAITQTGGTLTAATLDGSAALGVGLTQDGNAITTLGSFTSGSGFALKDARTLTVAGPVTDPTGISLTTTTGDILIAGDVTTTFGTLLLESAGAITQTGGTLTAATLDGNAALGVGLTLAGNVIATLGSFTSGSGFALTDGETLTIAGPLTDQTGISLTTTAGDIVLAGDVTTTLGTLLLTSADAITQTGGTVTAATLDGSAALNVGLTLAGNAITNLGGFTSHTGFALKDARSLRVGGSLQDPTGIALTTTSGDIDLAGDVTTGALLLTSAGAITQTGGTLTAAMLDGSAALSVGLTLAGNAIATLGSFTSGSGFALKDGETLLVDGPVTDSTGIALTTTSGDIVLAGDVTTTLGTLLLTSAGAITQTGGTVTAATLDGSAALGVGLTLAGNAIATLGSFTSGSGFALQDARTLTVAGPLTDATGISLTTTAGDIVLSGDVTTTFGTLLLTSAGAITQTGGTVTAATLDGSAALGVGLTLAGNAIVTLGSFTSGSGFALKDARTLTVAGSITDPTGISLTTTSGDILLAGDLTTTLGTLLLGSAGAITQTGGTLTAATLAGSAALGVGLTLAGNAIATLGSFTSGSGFALRDARTLLVDGPLTDPTGISLTTTVGDIVLAGDVMTTLGTLLLESAGAITQTGGTLTAAMLDGSAALGVGLTQDGNAITTLASFTSGSGFALRDARTLLVDGPVTDPTGISLTTTSGDILLAGDVTTTLGTLLLTSAGAITQTGGTLTAATLDGSAALGVGLTQDGNGITTLGSFTSGGGFALTDARTLTVVGPITDPTGISLTTTSGDIVFAGNVLFTPTLSLFANAGAITQVSGAINATTLTGTAAGTVDLGLSNTIATLAGFTSTGGFLLNDLQGLQVTGPVADTARISLTTAATLALAGTLTTGGTVGSSVTLAATGTISQTGGFIETGTLTGSGAAATLDNTGNLIASLGSFSGHAGVLLTDAIPLTIAGTLGVDPGNTIRIRNDALTIAPGGQVVASAGTVALAPFAAGHAQSVAGGNGGGGASSVIADTLIIGGGTNRVAQASALSLPGAFNLSGVRLIDLLSTGDIIQTGLIVQPTGSLTGIGANVGLTGAGNEFATLAGFTAGGNFALVSAGEGLTITGLVQAGSQLALDVTGGGITLGSGATGGTLATPALITLTTDQAVTEPNGGIKAGTLSLAASSAALTGANAIGTLGTVGVTDAFDLTDAASLTVAGPVTANRATFGITGNLVLDGRIAVAADLDTFVTGSITQPGGTVQANSLTGSAAAVALGQANAIGTLGSFSVGSFFLNDLSALTIAGPVTAGSVQLVDAGGVTLAGNLSAGTLAVSVQGALVQTGGALSLGTLTGAAAAVALNDANAIGTVDGFTSAGAFSLATTGDLQIAGLLAAGSQVTLNVGGTLSENAGSITAPSLTGTAAASLLTGPNRIQSIADGGFDPPGDFVLQDQVSLAINGPLTAATLSLSVLGDLVLNAPLISSAMTLDVSGAITQPGGSLSTGSLTGNAASAMLDQPNGVGTLAGFKTAGAFSLVDSGSLTVSGPLAAATATLQTGGAVDFAANVTANVLQLAAAGSAVQSGGVLNVGTLSGSAGQLAQFGADGNGAVAAIGTLGPFTVNGAGGQLFLADSQPLTLQPPLAADFIAISAPGSVTLAGGSVTTGGLPLASQAAGTAPQGPGSYIHVTGAGATFRQTGNTSIDPASGYATATLRIQTDGIGSILLESLAAPRLDLILDAGTGNSSGSIVVGGLTVLGSNGSAALTGLVDGFGGKVAARVSNITPTANRNYQINACPLQSVNCVVLSVQAVPVPAVLNDVAIGALAAPPDDPDLLLPNISDRDY
jgi:filamentous hemagglutinin family protein